MRSLLLRIFLSFWLIIVVTISTAGVAGFLYAERMRDAIESFDFGDAMLDASAALEDAGREVLLLYRFTINQRDRRAGLITTNPTASRHFFEWWRRDKATASGALENSVQPIYREVSVEIRKTDEGK